MNKKCVALVVLLLSAAVQTAFAEPSPASETPAKAEPAVYFSIKAKIPDNQINKRLTYFDLRVSPGDTQTLEIEVFNNSLESLEVSVEAHAASTNQGGLIEYTKTVEKDASLKHSFADIASVETPRLSVGSGQTETARISMAIPLEPFDGVILGGIVVTKLTGTASPSASPASAASTSITNEYAYVVGVRLSENDALVEPDFRLRNIEPTLVNYKPALAVNLQNHQPAIVKGLSIAAKVYALNSSLPAADVLKDDIDVAPNSSYDFIIDWNNAPIAPGDYRLQMKATLGERVWEWDEGFTVGAVESSEVNSGAIGLEKKDRTWLYILIGVGALLILALVYIATRRRANKSR